jgi:membrane-associated protease RseP (regulator of RpoE activity)
LTAQGNEGDMKIERDNRIWRASLLGSAIAAVLGLTGLARADVGAGTVSPAVQERVRQEMRALLTELIETGAFGDQPPQQITLDIDAPAQRVNNLGVLVDSAHASRDGLAVLGVTPGGSAERMGLRAGDVLVALNGTALTGSGATATLRERVEALPDGGTLDFEVRRGGRTQTVSGTLARIYLPAMHLTVGGDAALAAADPAAAAAGCGRISQFDVAPRQQDLHGAKVISIDGQLAGPTDSNTFRVAAGRHTLQVSERIESRYLSFNDRLRNSTPDRYKTLVVDVLPNTTTLIAARLNPDKRTEWKNGAYWDPVAWKQIAEPCR